MNFQDKRFILPLITITLLLSGCGGSTSDIASASSSQNIQPPVSTPTPIPPPTSVLREGPVEMLAAPKTQEFATYNMGDPLRIRYDSNSGRYEVMATGEDWIGLIDEPKSDPGLLLFANKAELNDGYFSARVRYTHQVPELRYQYSSLASWNIRDEGQSNSLSGITAFGSATPEGLVPLAGSAQYNGLIEGEANVPALSGWGDSDRAPIAGSVSLNFDFGRGTLAGQIRPTLACDCEPIAFPTLDFAQTLFGQGSTAFAGKFKTDVVGLNSFSGIFTGPNAEELIGKWTFPFVFSGMPKEATGVWVAKRN
jgi:hypothetical protein